MFVNFNEVKIFPVLNPYLPSYPQIAKMCNPIIVNLVMKMQPHPAAHFTAVHGKYTISVHTAQTLSMHIAGQKFGTG